jgi:lipid II:glycine glycyltransferase (peptidoglycan interpeptide bridge formation enzyme)
VKNSERSKDYFGRLLQILEMEVKEQNFSFFKLRLQASSFLNSFMPSRYIKYNEYCTFVLDLSEGSEKIFRCKIHKKTRTAIRKAIKLGVEVSKELPDVEAYWRFYKETIVRSKGIFDEKRINLFKLVWRRLEHKKDFMTLTATFKGKPIGGIIAFLFRDKVHVWYNSSLSQFLYLNPNEFLYWKLIEEAVDKGYKYLDFGPTPLRMSEGHYFFKSRFGGTMIPFNDYAYFASKIRYLLIEGGALQLAKKLNVRRKVPEIILQKMSGRVIF